MKSATACKSSMRRERCAINGPLATRTRAMRSCRVSGMCARNLAPLHRRRGPHAIPSHAGARHLVSMRGSCLGCMDGMGRVGFPHLHDTLTPGQPHARTCASPDLGVGEEGSRFSIGRGLDLRVIEGWSMSTRAGQIIQGAWRARSLTWDDFCASSTMRKVARSWPKALAVGHEQLPSSSPRTMTATDLATCRRRTREKGYCRLQRLKSTLIWRKSHFSHTEKGLISPDECSVRENLPAGLDRCFYLSAK